MRRLLAPRADHHRSSRFHRRRPGPSGRDESQSRRLFDAQGRSWERSSRASSTSRPARASRSASRTARQEPRPRRSSPASLATSRSSRPVSTSTPSPTPASSPRTGRTRRRAAWRRTRSSRSSCGRATRSTSTPGQDLTKPGVQVVTPDPFPSGSAKWNVLAAYGQARKSGMSNTKAVKFVTKLFKNVVAQPSSASSAANAFFSGQGDVLITYESEAYTAFAAGKPGKLVVPKPTMLIQLPMVPTKTAPARGDDVHQVLPLAEAAEDPGRERLPPGRSARC